MSIKDQLTEDMKQAMKDREAGKLRLSVIRMVRANIKNVEINEKKELNDDEVLAILLKEVKMRQDSLVEFEKADEELRVMVAEAISETGAEGPKAIGKVMPAVMAKAKGRADGKRINQMVRELLQ